MVILLFSSIQFIFYFFPVFLCIYLAAGMRTAVLLGGSIIFYAWGEGEYVLLLSGLIAINNLGSRWLGPGRRGRGWLLLALLVVDLAVLFYFKYANFVGGLLNDLSGRQLIAHIDVRMPLGVSFFTFQLISYLLDVYWGKVKSEPSLSRFATYILMFPHLIAGPIVRYALIRDELASRHGEIERFGLGLQYFIVGLCQKVLIANTVASFADFGFAPEHVAQLAAWEAWLSILSYTLQIYFDFCGYSNMAIGLAFMLGFTFPKNFDHPYAATSITDFWRRWHMSLSFWFRDYVYIPLGGSRNGRFRTVLNLLLVFFLTGLWHGAAWNFIFWGMFHGAFLIMERLGLGKLLSRLYIGLQNAYVWLIVGVGWVFFRAETFKDATLLLKSAFGMGQPRVQDHATLLLLTPEYLTAIVLGCIFAYPVLERVLDRFAVVRMPRSTLIADSRLDTHHVHPLPISLLLVGFVLCVALLASNSLNPFLYFRF